ncbi:glutathione S-transferase family protein [Chitiniphilus eburneus]|uniref:Glutathione S-transferase family protein n=1 Tax=Chitiniphilus eburneus TaxID=2571148 RepID=A0A4U0PXH8_9NEIS|nr:glutathione S-transferase family protein [Chitiniphilus eburneus]TJZ73291.1 glutathione S-transferase family protein [Chitiniphilus eburneus]
MIELIQVPFSHFCAKVRIALNEKGLPHRCLPVPGGWMDSVEYRVVNPLGRVPFLVDGDIRLGESQVINEYLEDRYPQPSLMPSDAAGRARVRWLCSLHDNYCAPQIFRIFFGLVKGQAPDAFADDWQAVLQALDLLEAQTDDAWLAGPAFSLADCTWVLSWMHAQGLSAMLNQPLDAETRYPRLLAWAARAESRPAVASVMTEAKAALAAM